MEAARAGAGRSYVYGGVPVTRHPEIAAAEAEARAELRGLWGPPCNGATSASSGAATPAPLLQLPASPDAAAAPPPTSTVYYDNCRAARAAGAAPLRAGQPGYRPGLDGDGDGVACES
ncbi:excalibur calcium-binding domain-containing protein [Mycolicibacterium sp. 120270]|uniref:excalibur calcium-binding domain-containing protein n=1 Tax=Mycolicibacterium sp. 120270 TaxID=3090600 RepID=UPI00299DA883|nr:excalibur calcium-binding domain-containing protein [Mycolicibacterium sp. 120270]MDX1887798.1 excalibur calcium-binding domain-containing protein [Mycolicibacterium sp. 120270]